MEKTSSDKINPPKSIKESLHLDVYNVEVSPLSMSDDPTVKRLTEKARQFLKEAGLPDIEKFRKDFIQ